MRNILLAGVASIAMFAAATQANAYERWLDITNSTSVDLCEVYISHVGTDDWQSDRIGPCISPGEVRRVNPGYQQGYCRMDMNFVFADGSEVTRHGFDICSETDFVLYD